jgi:hypothetical protein
MYHMPVATNNKNPAEKEKKRKEEKELSNLQSRKRSDHCPSTSLHIPLQVSLEMSLSTWDHDRRRGWRCDGDDLLDPQNFQNCSARCRVGCAEEGLCV